MALWDRVSNFLALTPWAEPTPQTRTSLSDFVARIQGTREQPWRVASIREAMSVPAIFRAVTFISNITGSLSMRGYRKGVELPEDERPRLIVRPDPFNTPREFYRSTAYSMATRGEAWWWVAARDMEGQPISLIAVNPAEVTVTPDYADPRYPVIEWRGRPIPHADMKQIKLTGEVGELRGEGPLQMCGAAVSVAVEAQEWAANFFAEGGYPSVVIKTASQLSEQEAADFLAQWEDKAHNRPRIIDPGVEDVSEFRTNPQGAQMLQARDFQNGDAARMFGIPGTLLDHAVPGSSLTYQNVTQEFDKFVRSCLLPDYLEPMEQAMSDLLTRSTVARFNTEALLRADIKTRYEVATLGFEKGVIEKEEARSIVGVATSIETAPVPFAPPAAFPESVPVRSFAATTGPVRCDGEFLRKGRKVECNKLLAEAGPFVGTCERCKTVYAAAA